MAERGPNDQRNETALATDADDQASGSVASATRDLPPLNVSRALVGWSRGMLGLGWVLLLALLLELLLVFLAYAWSVDLMIVLAGLPVVVAVVWIVRRAVTSAADGFVRGITSTPLVAITPPPRPATLASPAATLRALGVLPALGIILLAGAVVAGVDAWAASTGNVWLRVGTLAVTFDGLAVLAVLVLTLGGALAGLGRAIAARERDVGARFYALAAPADASGQGGALTAVCAVPEPM